MWPADALGVKNGPSHAEVIVTPYGPCLVEVGSRPHGGPFLSVFLVLVSILGLDWIVLAWIC